MTGRSLHGAAAPSTAASGTRTRLLATTLPFTYHVNFVKVASFRVDTVTEELAEAFQL